MSKGESSYNLRAKEHKSIFECYNVEEEDLQNDDDSDRGWNRKRLREKKKRPSWGQEEDYEYNIEDSEGNDSDIFDSQEIVDRLPECQEELTNLLVGVKGKIKTYKQQFIKEQNELKSNYAFTQLKNHMSQKMQFRFAQM